jgi:hypothetical protein
VWCRRRPALGLNDRLGYTSDEGFQGYVDGVTERADMERKAAKEYGPGLCASCGMNAPLPAESFCAGCKEDRA